ncbi:MAG: hypothetical protein AMJ92_03555 [candidate division Zixibacteria bacterium SM23_81]|nr:MAG: hypothetical protein AMJ92_03555 [candidate division Zixibacteria bacterium SM23_81]
MRTALLTTFVILLSAGICWGQMDITQIYFDDLRVVPAFGDTTILDDYEGGVLANGWWDPDGSGSTYGTYYGPGEAYNTNSSVFVDEFTTVYAGTTSAKLEYQWEHTDSAGFIREYPQYMQGSPNWSSNDKVQVWIYGNNSLDQFRFCIDDSDGMEGSPWIPIDWTGWQLVTFDLAVDPVVGWVNGNGVIDGPMVSLDSYQILKAEATVVEPQSMGSGELPRQHTLSQNYPNPFNAETQIQFIVAKAGHVSLKVYNATGQLVNTLVEEEMATGSYRVSWNGTDQQGGILASGVYFCRMEADGFAQSIKMTFLR